MERMRETPITDEELSLVKATASGDFARSLERPQTLAGFALNVARFGLPIDFYDTYLERLNAVTAEDILKAARKYLRPTQMHILVVGNAEALSESLKRFDENKEVRMLDVYGDVVGELKLINPKGMKAVDVIQKYIDAIGGEEVLHNIKSLEILSSGALSGTTLDSRTVYALPDRMAQQLSAGGNVMQEQVINGQRIKITQMGRSQLLEGEGVAGLLKQADVFHELKLLQLSDFMELKTPTIVNGKKCFRIDINYGDGAMYSLYFDMETGFKVREDNPLMLGDVETRQFMDYDQYEEVGNGLVFAKKMTLTGPSMPTPLIMNAHKVIVNPTFEDQIFTIE
jgi:zinc protease